MTNQARMEILIAVVVIVVIIVFGALAMVLLKGGPL